MRWLIIQSNGEHHGQDGLVPNWFLRECFSLQDALYRCGHLADIWGPRHESWKNTPDFKIYDAMIIAEQYEDTWLPNVLSSIKVKKFHWIIDLHVRGPQPYLKVSRLCDICLHATKDLMTGYSTEYPAQHVWFPNAVDDRYFNVDRYPDTRRETRAVFIGGGGSRAPLLKDLQRSSRLTWYQGVTGYGYIKALRQAKIGFNAPISGDVNYRNFESIAMGACLVTRYDPCLVELGFVHGVNCLMYHTPAEAAQLLETPDSTINEIAARGRQLAARHSYAVRVRDYLLPLV